MYHEFMLLKNKNTLETKIAEELNDDDFSSGFRLIKYLKNSEIDYVKYLADVQEDADKKHNEKPMWHKVPEYNKPHTPTLFNNCDGWRYV